jgi:hypothetical protein
MNSAEILADQGEWDRAVELLDDAVRNFTAVGYPVGVAAARLFAGVAQMRRGRLADAAAALDEARHRLHELGVAELLDEVEVRELELAVVRGDGSVEDCDKLIEGWGDDHPFRGRVHRLRGLIRHQGGDPSALDDVIAAIDLEPTGLERALTLETYGLIAGKEAPGTVDEVERLRRELGIVRLPPLTAGPVSVGT